MLQAIDTTSPVNWNHPLNQGLVFWLYALPGVAVREGLDLSGSRPQWRNLCGIGHATFNSYTLPTIAYNDGRPHNYGSVLLSGNRPSDYLEVDSHQLGHLPTGGNARTWSIWFRSTSGPTTSISRELMSFGDNVAGQRWGFGWWWFDGSQYQLGLEVVNNVIGFAYSNSSNSWDHLVCTCPNSATLADCALYLNGTKQSSYISLGSGTQSIATTQTRMIIGALNYGGYYYDSGGYDFSGYLDDMRIYNRKLSDAEVMALYQESRRGHTGTLRTMNRWSPVSFGAGGGGGIQVPPFVYQMRVAR